MTDPVRIGLIRFDGAQRAALYGLTDFFDAASDQGRASGAPVLQAVPLPFEQGTVPRSQALHAVICPPRLQTDPLRPTAAQIDWLRERHGEGAVMCSVCAGAFLLGAAGLLDGRPATTHWGLRDTFAEAFPRVRLDIDRLLIDEGDVVTAGGVMAWVDLGLHLIERFQSPALMVEIAHRFLVEPGRREQRYYSKFSPQLGHGDGAVLRVQHWLQRHFAEPVTVGQMAEVAVMSERSFLRRFRKVTDLSPIAYLQALRVEKARAMLELSSTGVSEIAWRVGYQDVASFRTVFQKLIGLTPQEYRRRFGVV